MNAKKLFDIMSEMRDNGYNLNEIEVYSAEKDFAFQKGEYSDAVFSTNRIDYSKKKVIDTVLHERQRLILM